MVSVFLSHSSKDKAFVRELADFLGRDEAIQVWLDEREIAPGDNIVGEIGCGLDADFVLLILSPDSVNSNWVKEEWTDAFWEQTNNRKTKLLGALYRDCTIPRLLRNKKYFDLRTNHLEGFREIRTFLLEQRPVRPERVNYLPARPPIFVGREPELADLRRRFEQPGAVAYVTGLAGKGKSTLALEFAHRGQRDFAAVYWLPCQSSNLASIAGDLARQTDLNFEGDLQQVVRDLKLHCAGKRCLLVLDNVDDEALGELIPGGIASVLITTRRTNLRFLRSYHPVALTLFTDDQCFDLFRRQLGAPEVARYQDECGRLFQRLGYLPIAVAIAAGLIREDVHFTIPSLLRDLPDDVTALIREAIGALDPATRRLLAAMSACAAEGFFLDLAAEIAGLDETASLDALQQLVARSLAEELDRADRRYRLHALVRETADGKAFAQTHAEAVARRFEGRETNWRRCEQELPDLRLALEWTLQNSVSLAHDLAYKGYSLARRIGRPTEAFDFCERMRRVSEEQEDRETLQVWVGSQALILKDWGRLEEALALHKKKEAICLELGNKDGLGMSYGNEALILQAWGRLEEALALHKKKEAICLELGNKSGLAYCYWNWGLLERDLGHPEAEQAKLSAALSLFRELGMPGETKAVEQELAKARAANAS